MGYTRLTQKERYQIETLLKSGLSKKGIASQLCRSAACIGEEIRRNSVDGVYRAEKANRLAKGRRKEVHRAYKVTGALERKVRHRLNLQWSPEQISGRLRQSNIIVSHETIYRYVYRRFKVGDNCYINLRRKRKRRYSRMVLKNRKNIGFRRNRRWIEERPSIVEERFRLGDFERDTVLGKFKGPVLLTIVDRTSRKLRMKKIDWLNSHKTHLATCQLLKRTNVHTITNDNGPEFDSHKNTAKILRTKIYFNHPYSSWQRGSNENMNGLVRQYFKKGTDFTCITDEEIAIVESLLNNRPRKVHGYRTPNEVEKLMNQEGVTLST